MSEQVIDILLAPMSETFGQPPENLANRLTSELNAESDEILTAMLLQIKANWNPSAGWPKFEYFKTLLAKVRRDARTKTAGNPPVGHESYPQRVARRKRHAENLTNQWMATSEVATLARQEGWHRDLRPLVYGVAFDVGLVWGGWENTDMTLLDRVFTLESSLVIYHRKKRESA